MMLWQSAQILAGVDAQTRAPTLKTPLSMLSLINEQPRIAI